MLTVIFLLAIKMWTFQRQFLYPLSNCYYDKLLGVVFFFFFFFMSWNLTTFDFFFFFSLSLSNLQLSQIPYPGGVKSMVPEAPAPPNNILFVQNLAHDTTSMMLQMLFYQYPGFKEVRMVEAKPGIAFVEYENEMHSSVAMQNLQGFKLTPQNSMLITYAKK